MPSPLLYNMHQNKILTAANAALKVTNLYGTGTIAPSGLATLEGLPIGTAGDSATGEMLLKVSVREGGSSPAAVVYTPSITTVSASGTVASGKHAIEFQFGSTFTGTVGSVAYDGSVDAAQTFPPVSGATYAAISYVVTTGSFRLVTY